MSTNEIVWTPELKNELAKFWQRGDDITTISDRIGVPYEKVKSAIQRARRGVWGEEFRKALAARLPVSESTISADNEEARERGMSYGQLQAGKLKESARHDNAVSVEIAIPEPVSEPKPDTTAPIDMIAAVDILTACAKLFGMDELMETRGSKHHDKAAITFQHGERTYVLEIFGASE